MFEDWEAHRLIPSQTPRRRTGRLLRSKRLCIMVLFSLAPFKPCKVFDHDGIGRRDRAGFSEIAQYDRLVSPMARLFAPSMVRLQGWRGEPTGRDVAAAPKRAVWHQRRIHHHQVFAGLAARGNTRMGKAG